LAKGELKQIQHKMSPKVNIKKKDERSGLMYASSVELAAWLGGEWVFGVGYEPAV